MALLRWPLTARAICLWGRIAVRATSMYSRQVDSEAFLPLDWIYPEGLAFQPCLNPRRWVAGRWCPRTLRPSPPSLVSMTPRLEILRARNPRGKTPGAGWRVQCGAQPDEASNTLTRRPATHNRPLIHAHDSTRLRTDCG